MTTRTPTLASLLNFAKQQTFADLRVSLPGRIERYDSSTQLADVKPLLKESFLDENGDRVTASLPVITNVPIVFQGGGGMRITFPVRAGDTVLLIFSDKSLDAWLDQGGEATPDDDRRHHLSDAMAIPGLHPNNAPWSGAEDGVVTLGSDSGAADFVALSTATKNEITALRDTVDAFVTLYNAHQHLAPPSGGPTTPLDPADPPAIGPAPVGEIKSNTVKIKG